MHYQDILIRESATLPEYLKRELLDFLLYLKSRERKTVHPEKKAKPKFGCGKISVRISDDFDAPLADFKEYES